MDQDKILEVKNLTVVIAGKKIIENVSFDLHYKETLAVIGPNGAGKSTLLKAIVGIIDKYEGEIKLAPNIKVGYLPQRFNVDTYLPITLKEFLSLKPHPQYTLSEISQLLYIPQEWYHKSLSTFSSGQLQKILLAWCILDKPQLLLFDEPTENVDIVSKESIYQLLNKLQNELALAIILVSHDLNVVFKHTHKVLCLNNKMICFGPPLEEITLETIKKLYPQHAIFEHHH